jgi:hypothetical protein
VSLLAATAAAAAAIGLLPGLRYNSPSSPLLNEPPRLENYDLYFAYGRLIYTALTERTERTELIVSSNKHDELYAKLYCTRMKLYLPQRRGTFRG